ncbi:transcriptional regulator, DeoR family [Roseovarius pacificus]|uniref:Transcriptional regulator, DeoR family n=1 Tax=Roseovarius pacificus TaxID=337701 RepID=A0A1M6YP88_9RHOB|nr:DeoR/GlpR family DNA-binding transcription regulator [Roseovarius pacificus]MBU3258915.1 DeoR/GlpR family DNA-binding transcription regulator [Roseovarius sp. PS-C2]MDW3118877.1 DeoR/GlpR family DNA-binding transcription regulator [Roseovarius pacificus]GGO50567.1 DeoR family transcriptional regulator [Roseovarius pacificus]SHL20141.1 transcriptional regulator, DeoR family [Roseovarius pacificus]
MSQSFRQPDILEIARTEGKVMVEDLAERFDVTVQTIRRDLTELANAGKLERVHGGAILPSGVTNIIYDERRRLNEDAKQAIARACAAAIADSSSVFLDIGTTTEAVAHELLDHSNLMVVTNNMNVANILLANKTCEIVVAGGSLRRSDNGLVGNLTARTIENFKFDTAILGCSALDEDGDLLDFDIQEVVVGQTLLKRSREVFLVADHSKFQRSAPVRIGSLRDIDRIFTDLPLPGALAESCRSWGTDMVVTG